MENERRVKNVIVHGVPESQVDSSDQRVEEDLAVLAAMFQEVGTEEVQVQSVVRLGKRNTDSAHPRPMKVVLNSVDGKVKLLQNAKKLENKTGWRVVEDFYSSGPNPKAEGSQKATCSRTQTAQSEWRNRLNHLQWEGGKEKRTIISRDKLKCFYTNARSIVNKFEQFETYVHDLNPDIIGITESWTASHIFDSELTIDGYDLFRQDRPVDRDGGGVLLYVRSTLHAVQCNLSSKFPEQVWCYVLDSKGHHCYIGVCYRSPSVNIYGSGNHALLQDIINELGATRKHFVLMGDFNYRYQAWPPELDNYNISTEAAQFCHCIEDNFFYTAR